MSVTESQLKARHSLIEAHDGKHLLLSCSVPVRFIKRDQEWRTGKDNLAICVTVRHVQGEWITYRPEKGRADVNDNFFFQCRYNLVWESVDAETRAALLAELE